MQPHARQGGWVRAAGAGVSPLPLNPGEVRSLVFPCWRMIRPLARCRWAAREPCTRQRTGPFFMESSTVSPAWISELAEAVNQRGLDFLDAPVTGSRAQAATRQLTYVLS
jgi:hypothetical protein